MLCFGNPDNYLSTGYGFIVFLFCFAFFPFSIPIWNTLVE